MSEEKLKELFIEMCKHIKPFAGEIICLYSNMEYDSSYNHITKNVNYPLLKKKMENLLKLINEDLSWSERDIETELWDII